MHVIGLNKIMNGFTQNLNIINMNKIYWLTGQPGAGKTVLSYKLKEYLEDKTNKEVFHIDGDDLREIITNKDYSKEGREKNILLAQSIAKFLYNKKHDVIVSLVSPYLNMRESFKTDIGDNLKEIYVYTEDIRGREHFHSNEYEKPIENYIEVDTSGKTVEESFEYLKTILYVE